MLQSRHKSTIYLFLNPYDDEDYRLTYLEDVIQTIPELDYYAKEVTDEDSFKKHYDDFLDLKGDCAIILDLGLHDIDDPAWETTNEIFSSEIFRKLNCNFAETRQGKGKLCFPLDGCIVSIPAENLDGIALVSKFLSNNSPGKTLIYIASARGSLNYIGYVINLLIKNNGPSERIFKVAANPFGECASDPILAANIATGVLKEWEKAFPLFHEDPWINNCLNKWMEFYRTLKNESEGNGNQFCKHQHIEDNTEIYSKLARNIFPFSGDTEPVYDAESLKALFMLSQKADEETDAKKCFYSCGRLPTPGWKMIPKTILMEVLLSIFNNMPLKISPNELRLPLMPALPFLVSLKNLYSTLVKEKFINVDGTVEIEGQEQGPYRLTIPLVDTTKEFKIAKRWADKCLTGGDDISVNGVCGALWQTSLAEVKDIKSATSNNRENFLLKTFEGQERPIVGVCFGPHHIHLYWN